MIAQMLRFLGVGGIATVVHIAIASLAHGLLSVSELLANLLGFGVSVAVSYSGHSKITFAGNEARSGNFVRFIFVALSGLAASSTIVWWVSSFGDGSFYFAMGLVAIAVPLTTFLALKFWVFSQKVETVLPSLPMVLIAFIASIGFIAIYWNWPVNHDTAWYLVATRKMLDGARLYVDIIEVNPPLNFYLTIPALLIADGLSVSDTNGQYISVAGLYLTSLLWSGAILRRSSMLSPLRQTVFFAFVAVVYILGAGSMIAQREHLLVLFLSPWLFSQLFADQKPPSLATSAFAAIGICIKPFFLVFPITFLVRDMWKARSLRPIFAARYMLMLAIGVLYVVFVSFKHPEYLAEIVPTANLVYGAYKNSLYLVAFAGALPITFGFVAMSPLLFSRNEMSITFALAAFAALLCYFLQSTGFSYHIIPYIIFTLLAGSALVLNPQSSGKGIMLAAAGCSVLIAGLLERGKYQSKTTDDILRVAMEIGPVDSIFAGSSLLDPGSPVALRLGVDWVSRYPANWLYPGAMNRLAVTDCEMEQELCDDLHAIIERNRKDNLNDIVELKPELIVSDRGLAILTAEPISWMEYMRQDSDFLKVIKNYSLVRKTNRFDYYLLDAN